VLKLDMTEKNASVVTENKLYNVTSGTQGNRQSLPNGNVFIGWGQAPFFSEFTPSGRLLMSMRFPDPDESYRAYRYVWHAHPAGHPAAAARALGSRTRVYVSWNGATDVAAYRILTGSSSHRLEVAVRHVRRSGFETVRTIRGTRPYVKVQALSSRGRVLGSSRTVRRQNTSGITPAPVY
jgi:hypothetical protein